jgi:hypothetical protein
MDSLIHWELRSCGVTPCDIRRSSSSFGVCASVGVRIGGLDILRASGLDYPGCGEGGTLTSLGLSDGLKIIMLAYKD